MKSTDIMDPFFRDAVDAIDAGNMARLEELIDSYPQLLQAQLDKPTEGYFARPFLLWFIASNPVRIEKLPANILPITKYLIKELLREAPDSLQLQLDYALGLVATGRVPRESGLQLEMMDMLIDAGAQPGGGMGAVAHGNLAAANHLVDRGGELTLAVAICLERSDDVERLWVSATPDDLQTALVASAFYGKTAMVALLLEKGADPNSYPKPSSGFHSHATALHQAVFACSFECVKLLVEAGADPWLKDKVYEGTALGWSEHMQSMEPGDQEKKTNQESIFLYLHTRMNIS